MSNMQGRDRNSWTNFGRIRCAGCNKEYL